MLTVITTFVTHETFNVSNLITDKLWYDSLVRLCAACVHSEASRLTLSEGEACVHILSLAVSCWVKYTATTPKFKRRSCLPLPQAAHVWRFRGLEGSFAKPSTCCSLWTSEKETSARHNHCHSRTQVSEHDGRQRLHSHTIWRKSLQCSREFPKRASSLSCQESRSKTWKRSSVQYSGQTFLCSYMSEVELVQSLPPPFCSPLRLTCLLSCKKPSNSLLIVTLITIKSYFTSTRRNQRYQQSIKS